MSSAAFHISQHLCTKLYSQMCLCNDFESFPFSTPLLLEKQTHTEPFHRLQVPVGWGVEQDCRAITIPVVAGVDVWCGVDVCSLSTRCTQPWKPTSGDTGLTDEASLEMDELVWTGEVSLLRLSSPTHPCLYSVFQDIEGVKVPQSIHLFTSHSADCCVGKKVPSNIFFSNVLLIFPHP